MSNKKYTEMTDTEIKQHLADTAKWLSKKGYDGDAIMRPELQHINEQNAAICDLKMELAEMTFVAEEYRKLRHKLEAENADLRAQLAAAKKREDAAVEALAQSSNCDITCIHGRTNRNDCSDHKEKTNEEICFEWRGVYGTEGET